MRRTAIASAERPDGIGGAVLAFVLEAGREQFDQLR